MRRLFLSLACLAILAVPAFAQEDEEGCKDHPYWKIDFSIKEGAKAPGPLQIGRNYRNAMASKGGGRIVEHLDSSGGTFVANMPGPKGSGTIRVQVYVANFGDTQPVADNKTDEGRVQNRRVVLVKKS